VAKTASTSSTLEFWATYFMSAAYIINLVRRDVLQYVQKDKAIKERLGRLPGVAW